MTTVQGIVVSVLAVAIIGCANESPRPIGHDGKDGGTRLTTKDKCGTSKKCRISIDANYGTGTGSVSVDEMTIEKGSKDVDIVWQLTGGPCFFYPGAGDGVFLKQLDDPDGTVFPDQFATNDDSSYKPAKGKAKKFFWRDTNPSNNLYSYKVAFHCGSVAIVIDPVILNEGP